MDPAYGLSIVFLYTHWDTEILFHMRINLYTLDLCELRAIFDLYSCTYLTCTRVLVPIILLIIYRWMRLLLLQAPLGGAAVAVPELPLNSTAAAAGAACRRMDEAAPNCDRQETRGRRRIASCVSPRR